MRILHLTKNLPPFNGGIEAVTELMVQAGRRLGADVTVQGIVDSSASQTIWHANGVDYIGLPAALRLGPITFSNKSYAASELLLNADIVHLHMPNPLAEMNILWFLTQNRSKSPRPLIVPVVHADILRAPPLGMLWGRGIQQPLMRLVPAAIAATAQLISQSDTYRPFAEKVTAIPFPVAPLMLPPRRHVGPPLRMLAIGRAAAYKGFDVLLKAMVGTKHWYLTIAGPGTDGREMLGLSRSLRIESCVKLAGRVSQEEKCALLADADLVVVPSLTAAEAYGMTIVEAFAAAKPVLTTSIPTGMAFLARGGACGGLVSPGRVDELRGALDRLASDPARLKTIGADNYEFWRQELTPDVFYQRYKIFVDLLCSKRVHGGKSQ